MRILFIDGSTQLRTVRDVDRFARGGMVTSLFRVSDYLAKQGHTVFVLSDIQKQGQTKAGTNWIHIPPPQVDCLIANRGAGDGYPEIEARARFLWTHDLPHNGFIEEPRTIRAFACTVFMSNYAERIWRAFYKEIGRSTIIPNGVDKSLFFERYPQEKDFGYMIYASNPNRGLEGLPLITEAIVNRASRDVYCRAYSRQSVLHPGEGEDTFDYSAVRESIVDWRDPIPQKQFSVELGKAGLMILPTGYPEICSNVVLQALSCGTPIITTGGLGATREWVKHGRNGMLTRFQPHDYMIHKLEIVRHALSVLDNEALHKKLMRGARKTSVLSWQEVGKKWERLLSRYC